MKEFLSKNNIYYNKLRDWYKDELKTNKVEVLYVDREDKDIFAVTYLIIENENVEIARIFSIGDTMQISIDCKVNITEIQGIKNLILYGSRVGSELRGLEIYNSNNDLL